MRISMAAICKIRVDGKYLLVRNRHRQGYFGPFGGVIKHFDGAMAALDAIEFKLETKAETDVDLKDDLRGFLPGRNLGNFLLWFDKGDDREQAIDALRREIDEEAREAGLGLETEECLKNLKLRKVREIHEGPYIPNSVTYPQYRNLEVFEPVNDERYDAFLDALSKPTNISTSNFCFASRDEIEQGKLGIGHGEYVDNMSILPNVSYLFSAKIQKDETAPI